MDALTRRGVTWAILAASFVLLAGFARYPALADAPVGEAPLSIGAGQAYTIDIPPCDRQNTTPCPPSTRVYLPDTYVFLPNETILGSNIIAEGQEYGVLLRLINLDPRGINHTFTLASPAQEPLFILRLDQGPSANGPQEVHLAIGKGVRVNGGPPLPAVAAGPGPGEEVVNFYCSYHKDKGMTGRLILSPTHPEADLVKSGSQPNTASVVPQTIGILSAAIPLMGLPFVVLWRRTRRMRTRRRR